MNILIVDDDEVDREHIRRILLKSTDMFVIEETASVKRGLELLDTAKFDVVLLDFSMPKRDGIELLIEFKIRPIESLTAIIIVSHSQDEVLAAQCIREGAQDFIVKSDITVESLRRSIIYAQARVELLSNLCHDDKEHKVFDEKDSLTGLASRNYFAQVLDIALSNTEFGHLRLGLVLIDIDNFKLINDSMGYAVGDRALVYTGNKLSSLLPEGTFLARIGGDEFAYYFTYRDSLDTALNTVNQMINFAGVPIVLDGLIKVSMNMSVGIALSESRSTHSSELIRDAEIAMYRAKKQGGKQYCFFQESMQLQMKRRVDLENGLIRAVERKEFILNYQPVYESSGTKLWGFEVLLRWDNFGETVSPDEFVRIAEETKLIQPIGKWVIDVAFAELSKWNSQFNKNLKIAINLSPIQLENEELDQYIARKLCEYDIDPVLVEFEITETALLDFSEANTGVIERIDALGCDISLDDFGTGFSSFTGLQKLPISVIKIDRSIMPMDANDLPNKKLLGALIAMIDHLGLTAVAEGVETEFQYQYCQDIGVDRLQGYYLHKAMSLDEGVIQSLLR